MTSVVSLYPGGVAVGVACSVSMDTDQLFSPHARGFSMAVLRPSTSPRSSDAQLGQLAPFPLLRRPRPPPVVPLSSETPHKSTARKRSSEDDDETKPSGGGGSAFGLNEDFGAISTPVHPLPRHHPTPASPLRATTTQRCNLPSSLIHEVSILDQGGGEEEKGVPSLTRGPPCFPTRKPRTVHRSGRRKRNKLSPKKKQKEKIPDGREESLSTEEDEEEDEDEDEDEEEEEEEDYEYLPMFTDLSLLEEMGLYEPDKMTRLRERIISRQNYLKLTGWFATHVPQQDSLNTTILEIDHSAPERRKPHHQILLELQSMVDSTLDQSNEARINQEVEEGERGLGDCPRWPTPMPRDIVFRSSTSRYFLGEGRSNSPFESRGQPLISPSEVAILESMMEGGYRLSLKAHFLDTLPPLVPLCLTLTSLNISFNTLREFPSEILDLRQLKNLRMRNNPIKTIPNGIKGLQKLEDFCISFNCLTCLPPGLFELPLIQRLDLSHNYLQVVSSDISKLKTLQRLNLESNELIGLPLSLLSLPLTHLHLHGNYLHPILWKENCKSPALALVDMCCTVVVSTYVTEDQKGEPPSSVRPILKSRIVSEAKCDVCGRQIFGLGLRVVRCVITRTEEENLCFPLKSLPILFRVCSHSCKNDTRRSVI